MTVSAPARRAASAMRASASHGACSVSIAPPKPMLSRADSSSRCEVLEDRRDGALPRHRVDVGEIGAIDADAASLGHFKASQQLDQRRLPAPFRPTIANDCPIAMRRSRPS